MLFGNLRPVLSMSPRYRCPRTLDQGSELLRQRHGPIRIFYSQVTK
jgi:hypothetical protein